jgi:LPXTG-site transpeptidase (sortase) family protein
MRRRTSLFAGTLIVAAVAAATAIVLQFSGDGPGPTDTTSPLAAATATEAAGAVRTPDNAAPSEAPLTTPSVEPRGIEVARIVMPSLGIDAPIVTLGIDGNGAMLSPDNPVDVAWYSFSALPGEGSNVVMAGHLDYVNYGPAVFYRLKDARPGEEVHLSLVDGTTARYRVLDVTSYDEATAPVQEIVGPTDREIVTLITCGGAFDPLAREYNKRVVLRAERILGSAQAN